MSPDRCAECDELHQQQPANWCCHCPCHLAAARLEALLAGQPDPLAGWENRAA